MRLSRYPLLVVFFSLLLLTTHSVLAQRGPLRGFDAYVNKALRDWEVPGLAIGIVKEDSVVLLKGYGLRTAGTGDPVDEWTLFGIASCTKAFTAASLAILVDEGKIKWDERVVDYLKSFELSDPFVTRELTIRDLLCHRSGLPAYGGDLIWWGSTATREETLRRVRHVVPASSFRSRYAYQNIMFIAAGEIIPAVTGKSWEDFVRERIFAPLNMTSSSTSGRGISGAANIATPHIRIDGKVVPIPWRIIDNGGPAASINSNVKDMAEWIRVQLGSGNYRGKTIFSATVAEEMWSPQTIVPVSTPASPLPAFLKPDFAAYGLGWGLGQYRGHKIVRHYGETDGMSSVVGMLPSKKLGVVILTNHHTTTLHTALLYRIFDAYLGVQKEDWSSLYLTLRQRGEENERKREAELQVQRVKGTSTSLPLEQYAGTYESTVYGEAVVTVESERLVVALKHSPTYVADLGHWHFDTFRSVWRDPIAGKTFVSFVLNTRGKIEEMKLTIGTFIDYGEYVFKRKE